MINKYFFLRFNKRGLFFFFEQYRGIINKICVVEIICSETKQTSRLLKGLK